MENWDEVRTAYQVARRGTVSGAAEELGVHHATVIRHIDALERRLGVKLFQRHARGYTATEAGEDLLRVAKATDDQFSQLLGRIKGRGDDVSGELVVTSLMMTSPWLVPILQEFQDLNPGLKVRFLTGMRLYRLEYGEAHVAVRAGAAPDQPDNVVQPLMRQSVALFASPSYVARHGQPKTEEDFAKHRFVGPDDETRAPYHQWMAQHIPADNILFRSNDPLATQAAVLSGAGIGFLAGRTRQEYPDLIEIAPPRDEWEAQLWLVTHVDLHRTAKVQTFTKFLKERVQALDCT